MQAECRERQNEEDVEGELKRAVDEERKLEEELKELAMRHVDALKEIFGDDSVSYPLGFVEKYLLIGCCYYMEERIKADLLQHL